MLDGDATPNSSAAGAGSRARASVVDALLGTGFEGAPREPRGVRDLRRSTSRTRPWWPATCPPGVNASTGEVEAEAVRAAVTATFHGSKVGAARGSRQGARGARGGGGDRDTARRAGAAAAGLIAERVLDLYPAPPRSGSKFDSGVVVVVGGSMGLTGAPTMAARSAARAGAGYVQVAVPGPGAAGGGPAPARADEPRPAGRRRLPHARRGWPRWRRWPSARARWCSGPGLGRAEGAQEFARGARWRWRCRCWWTPTA